MTLKLPFIPPILIFIFNQAALHFLTVKKKKEYQTASLLSSRKRCYSAFSDAAHWRHVQLHYHDETCALCLEVNKLASGLCERRANAGRLRVVTNLGEASALADVTQRLPLKNNTANMFRKTAQARGGTSCLPTGLEKGSMLLGKR